MRKRKILVIDDEPGIGEIIRANMPLEGYEIGVATSGMEGLRHIRSHRPDLIILDVLMPDLDGFQLLQRLKGDVELADVPVIMLTIKADTADIIRGLEAGAIEYVAKPFDPFELMQTIRLLIETCDQRLQQARRHNRLVLSRCCGKSLNELFPTYW